MSQSISIGMLALVSLTLVAAFVMRRAKNQKLAIRAVVGGMLSANGLILVLAVALVLLVGSPAAVSAEAADAVATADSGRSLGAALATGLACIGAGIAVGIAGAAAIGGITEKPEILGKALIFVGLAEGIAIYGLIISFMILNG